MYEVNFPYGRELLKAVTTDSAADDDLRGCFRAARRLNNGDDPIDIGKYADEEMT